MLSIVVGAILLANLLFFVYAFVRYIKLKRDFERRRQEMRRRRVDAKEDEK